MTRLRLSLLDQSPTGPAGPAAAIQASIRRAQLAEQLGLTRVWFAEHSRHAAFAGSSPLTLAAAALSVTERIRVGTGGVLAGFHPPRDVAAAAGVLENGFPGRVDIGLGRANADLDSFSCNTGTICRYLATAGTPLWILGVGQRSAQHANELGAGYAFGNFFNPRAPQNAFTGREPDQPNLLAVRVIVRDEECAAHRAAAQFAAWRTRRDFGHNEPLPEQDDPIDIPQEVLTRNLSAVVSGTPQQVAQDIQRLAETSGAGEVMLTLPEPRADLHERGLRAIADELLSVATG